MTAVTNEPLAVTIEELSASTADLLNQVKESRQPLTVNGDWVVLDAATYERLLDGADRLSTLSGVLKGIREVDAGLGRPAEEVLERIRHKHFGVTT